MVRVALDAMGGDHAPGATVAGAVLAARAWGYQVQLVGREADIRAALSKQGDLTKLDDLLEIVHAPEMIEMDEHPASAVRSKRQSSMAVGVNLVKKGAADCFVSAGNTGGVLATALLGLRRIEGITSERPALAAQIPTTKGTCVVLDVGANVDVKPEWLAQFALMGGIYAEVLGRTRPTVATLSNGEEEGKGNALLTAAVPLIKALPINYVGNVEGNHITDGSVDVVVVDGFAGNIFLKSAEGVVATMTDLIRQELTRNPFRAVLAAGLRPAFRAIRERLSYETTGGVPLLGVNGVCIVAHGRSTPVAIQNAINAGARCVELKLVERIRERVGSLQSAAAG
ncbi:MAG TPA: phosphate acyltransferase PlsX [Chloroflexota bacterium]|jgi:glycerol-3-phosphate acyltransferase PlsX|nr:phosphate acyltransferase PlsX [Chloroflexota bacterium]